MDEQQTQTRTNTYWVHRYQPDVKLNLRVHKDTIGRFPTHLLAVIELEDRPHPEIMYIEERTEEVNTDD